jgi:hypothetical protein
MDIKRLLEMWITGYISAASSFSQIDHRALPLQNSR